MKLINYEVPRLADLLFNLPLKGKESRMRTRLVLQLDEYIKNTLQREEYALILEYGMKDEADEPMIDEDSGGYILVQETAQEYHKEHNAIQNEDYYIEENGQNKEMLLSVAESVINCDLALTGEMATLWDKWCGQFEGVIQRYDNI